MNNEPTKVIMRGCYPAQWDDSQVCSKVAVMVFIVWGWLREKEVMQRWVLIERFLALTHIHIHV